MIGQDSKRNPRCLSEPVKKSLGEEAMMREDKDLNGKRANTWPTFPLCHQLGLYCFAETVEPCRLCPLNSTPHCRLGPLSELPFCLFLSTCMFGCFPHITAECSVFNEPFSWLVKSPLKLIFIFLSHEWFPSVPNCTLSSIKMWLILNTVLLPKLPLCLRSCLRVKKIGFLADFIYFMYFLLCCIYVIFPLLIKKYQNILI